MSPGLLLAALLLTPAPPAGAVAPTGPAPATPLASDRPVEVQAAEVHFSMKTRQVQMVGRPLVTLVHDDATLTCRRLTGENDPAGKLRVAICEGEVRLTRRDRLVTCDRATYDRDAARVVCTGNPMVRQADGTEARGTTLTYDLKADEVRLEGTAQLTVPAAKVDQAVPTTRPPGGKP
jgi:lipopolysaccharide transport protein LptA